MSDALYLLFNAPATTDIYTLSLHDALPISHQIRVHLTHLGFPIAGDDKYGDFELNRGLAKQGLRRMFLHAGELEFAHPLSGEAVRLHAPLPEDLSRFLDSLGS